MRVQSRPNLKSYQLRSIKLQIDLDPIVTMLGQKVGQGQLQLGL